MPHRRVCLALATIILIHSPITPTHHTLRADLLLGAQMLTAFGVPKRYLANLTPYCSRFDSYRRTHTPRPDIARLYSV